MRDYVVLYINGREHRISGESVFAPVTDYLRYSADLCGTKVVCSEGDCGACTVLVGRRDGNGLRYKPINACIQFVYQLDLSHIVTVEGLKLNGELNPVQETMVDCHGAQCGYCTPGFIVAMSAIYDQSHGREPVSATCVKDGLTGNLCRCTGYTSIVEAGLEVDTAAWRKTRELYPEQKIVAGLQDHESDDVRVEHGGKVVFIPSTVDSLVSLKGEHPDATIISGGTDVCVNLNKRRLDPDTILSISRVAGLSEINRAEKDGRVVLEIGARVSLYSLEQYLRERQGDGDGSLGSELDYILWVFGSPQIRHAGTLAGNIANGSPIADSLPYLFVMDAQVEVASAAGRRKIAMTDFYEGYKKLAMNPDEVITGVHMPLPKEGELLKLYKVSRRQHLDISAFTAAICLSLEGDRIATARIAYGGVGPVVARLAEVEEFLAGKQYSLATFKEAGRLAAGAVEPISDVRGSRDYRNQLAENILIKFFYETADERELACL